MMRFMGMGVRTARGSTLRTAERQGAPSPGRVPVEDSMPAGIRELVRGWGGDCEPHDDDARRLRPSARFEHERGQDSRTRHGLMEGCAFRRRPGSPTSR
jgi:hypothetical protein